MKVNTNVIEKCKKSNESIYQITMPVLVDKKLKINYDDAFAKKKFKKVKSMQKSTNDLLYLNIVTDTLQQAFTMYSRNYEEDNVQLEFRDRNKKNMASFDVLEQSIIINSDTHNKSNSSYDSLYFSVTLKKHTCDLSQEQIICLLSNYTSKIGDKQVNSSVFTEEKEEYFFHGRNQQGNYPKNILNLLHYLKLDIESNEKYNDCFIFPNGKKMFVTYFINDDEYFNRIEKMLNGTFEDQKDIDLLTNIYESENFFKMTISNPDELADSVFYKKWIKAGNIVSCTPNSFGMICNNKSTMRHDVLFCKYNIAVFFALQQRIMNFQLQEELKGTSPNNYDRINNMYKRMEQTIFYEISGEIQLQTLYNMMQYHFKNHEITELITNEMQIHQNRRLNDLFRELTKYGLYLAIFALAISLPSYFATFAGEYETGDLMQIFAMIFANPVSLFIIIFMSYIYLKYKLNKFDNGTVQKAV